jgi:hypothetical protein
VGKRLLEGTAQVRFQKPYSIVSIFYLLERLRFKSVIFLHLLGKTINCLEDLANYPYPLFFLFYSPLPLIQASGKP